MNLAAKSEISLVSGATSLPNYVEGTGISAGDVSRWNQSQTVKSVKAFDIEIKGEDAVSLTAAELWGISVEENSFADKTISAVTAGTDQLTVTTHGLFTGQGPVRVSSSANDLPAGLDADTDYWVIKVDASEIQLATSLVNAFAETAVDITDAGSGTLALTDGAAGDQSYRANLLSYGLLGIANDGAVDVSEYEGYTTRVNHRPRVEAYYITATHPGAVAVRASVHPILED